jgi:hypothetical protein
VPTVLRVRGYRFYFYSHEPNEPPHVHIDRSGASVKIWLNPVVIARNPGFSPTELAELVRLVQQSRLSLLEAWDAFFS